jgi:hypothetical protein
MAIERANGMPSGRAIIKIVRPKIVIYLIYLRNSAEKRLFLFAILNTTRKIISKIVIIIAYLEI